jgi:hypothetical protein
MTNKLMIAIQNYIVAKQQSQDAEAIAKQALNAYRNAKGAGDVATLYSNMIRTNDVAEDAAQSLADYATELADLAAEHHLPPVK